MPYGHHRRPTRPRQSCAYNDAHSRSRAPRTSQDARGNVPDVRIERIKREWEPYKLDWLCAAVWLLLIPLTVAITIWTGYMIYLAVFT